METNKVNYFKKYKYAWILLGVGILLLVLGGVLRFARPELVFAYRLITAFGIFLSGSAVVDLVKTLVASNDPQAARQMVIEEKDERNQDLRRRAGNLAYLVSTLISMTALLVYSSVAAGRPGFDLLWYYLAFSVLAPGLVYIASLLWYHNHY